MSQEMILVKVAVDYRHPDGAVVGRIQNGFGTPEVLIHDTAAIPLTRLEGEKKPDHRRSRRKTQ